VEAYATVDDGEVWLRGLNIPEYTLGSWTNHEPRRTRKLLLHKEEIERLIGKIREGGLTLVPLSLYFSDGKVKCELALARGKRSYDKRSDLAKRDADREIQRAYGRAAKGRAREMR
jgi:SsrA-binding protein